MNKEGLTYLHWELFDSPDKEGSGYNFMEREPVFILDTVIHMLKCKINITLGYCSKDYADNIRLGTKDSHRLGKAIRLRVVGNRKRMKVVKCLIELGVTRIAVSRDTVYFDTDTFKNDEFILW